MGSLSDEQVDRFIADGYARLDNGFTKREAESAASVLIGTAGIDADDPSTWEGPVCGIDGSIDPAVTATINTGRVVDAIDQLLGEGNWLPRSSGFGTFPIRFSSDVDPGDAGWHIDGSFGEPPFHQVNLASRGRRSWFTQRVGHTRGSTHGSSGSLLPITQRASGMAASTTTPNQIHRSSERSGKPCDGREGLLVSVTHERSAIAATGVKRGVDDKITRNWAA